MFSKLNKIKTHLNPNNIYNNLIDNIFGKSNELDLEVNNEDLKAEINAQSPHDGMSCEEFDSEQDSPSLLDEKNHKLSNNSIHRSAAFGDITSIQELLKDEHDKINAIDSNGWTPLHLAAKYGQRKAIETLIKNGANINLANDDHRTPLHVAIMAGKRKSAKCLLKAGAIVNPIDRYNRTPLHYAATADNSEIIRDLVEAGADINQIDMMHETPLHHAASNAVLKGDSEALKALIDAGALINEASKCGRTPLHIVAEKCSNDIINLLLKAGAEVNSIDQWHETPLHVAAELGNNEAIKILVKAGANVNVVNNDNKTALHYATEKGNIEVIKELVESGANLNIVDNNHNSPLSNIMKRRNNLAIKLLAKPCSLNQSFLFYAIEIGNNEALKILLETGANLNATNSFSEGLLYCAIENSNIEAIKFLAEAGANINGPVKYDNKTALHYAVEKNKIEAIKTLLKEGANPNIGDKDGKTPLHYAGRGDKNINQKMQVELVKILLNGGANKNAVDNDGKTLLHHAVVENKNEIVDVLLKEGANTNVCDKDGETPLHYAVKNHNNDTIKVLLSSGADINFCDKKGNTPLHMAFDSNDIEVATQTFNTLLKSGNADINAVNIDGLTLLHMATKQNNLEIIRLLLAKGLNINVTDKAGNSPLFYVKSLNSEVTKYLINNRANTQILNKNGESYEEYFVLSTFMDFRSCCASIYLLCMFSMMFSSKKNTPDDDDNRLFNMLNDILELPEIWKGYKHINKEEANIDLNKKPTCNDFNKKSIFNDENLLHIVTKCGDLQSIKVLLKHNVINRNAKTKNGKTALQLAKDKKFDDIATYLEYFQDQDQDSLPKDITLSSKNAVLVRMWRPKIENEETSYTRAIFKSLFHTKDSNVGHITISIRNEEGEVYISHWPGEPPKIFKSVPGVNSTLESDIADEHSLPDEQIILYSLDTKKMIRKFKEIGEHAPWFLYGGKEKKIGDKAYNCSSYVYEILESGGLFNHLLPKKERLSGIINPIEVAQLAKKAKTIENVFYPATREFFVETMKTYRDELLEKSLEDVNAHLSVNTFLEKHPDYHILYKEFDPGDFKVLLNQVYSNIERSYSNTLLATITTCNFYKPNEFGMIIEDLLNRGATLIAKDQKGRNALHLAIKKNNYDCVAKLLEKFPEAVNSEIGYTRDNSNETVKAVVSPPVFLRTGLFSQTSTNKEEMPPLTPLDLAIDKNADQSIIDLLVRHGGITKNKSLKLNSSTRVLV